MPCVDGREFEDQQKQREALDRATRAACEAIDGLNACLEGLNDRFSAPKFSIPMFLSRETVDWWREHQELDKKRRKKS